MATMSPEQRVLATAAGEIGYSRWKDSRRGTKYARETQPVFWPRDTWLLANGISFCDLFVTWVFWKALGEDFVRKHLPGGASYNTDYRASKGGRISKSQARPGDVLVFDWNWRTASTNHVGILERLLPSGNFQTIEGNTSPGSKGSQGNGGGVYRRTRRPSQVRYVLRPNWAKAGGSAPTASRSSSSGGSQFADVDRTQQMLNDLGYGPLVVDGKWGSKTAAATKTAQTDLGITADGRPGPATRTALEEAMSKINDIAKKVDRLIAFGEQIHWRTDTMPQRLLDAPVELEGNDKGKTSSLRTKIAWQHHETARTWELIQSAQKAIVTAVQTSGREQGLSDDQIDRIAEAVAAVQAEDVAEHLTVTTRQG